METPIFLTTFQIFISLTNQGDATGIRQAPLVRTKVVAGHQSHRKWYPRLFNNIVENNLLFIICSSLVIILLHMQKGNKFQVFLIKCLIGVKNASYLYEKPGQAEKIIVMLHCAPRLWQMTLTVKWFTSCGTSLNSHFSGSWGSLSLVPFGHSWQWPPGSLKVTI